MYLFKIITISLKTIQGHKRTRLSILEQESENGMRNAKSKLEGNEPKRQARYNNLETLIFKH